MANEKQLDQNDNAPMIKGGGRGSTSGTGPTGSKSAYPKKGPQQGEPSKDASRFNPMNDGKNTFGINGV